MKTIATSSSLILLVLGLSSCSSQEVKVGEKKVADMKCGAGKCGANMFDGNAALGKKKENILSQMKDEDNRKDCVISSNTTKTLYDCVRDPKIGKLSLKYSSDKKEAAMKCGASKCGSEMK